jgi:3-deoxy-D-manno-octulosonate 8-phosphate phosphatase (KDO 8-P phosphatase)
VIDLIENIKFLVLDVDGTMTDGGVYISEDGKQMKKFNARDGIAIQNIIKMGIHVGIISHSKSSGMVQTRADMLGIKYCYVGHQAKEEVLSEWLIELSLDKAQVCFIGDDINDLSIMSEVGISACPSDAAEEVSDIATIQLSRKGGDSCIREFYDQYLR